MIRPLRARHRWTVALVGVVVGGLLLAALWVRRPVPLVDELPAPTEPRAERPAAGGSSSRSAR